MLFPLIVSLALSTETVESIKELMSQSKYQAAYTAANNLISTQGAMDADSQLYFLKGRAAYQIGKYEEAIQDMTKFLNSGRIPIKDQNQARSIRGNCNLKLGNIEDVQVDVVSCPDRTLSRQMNEVKGLLTAIDKSEQSKDYKAAFTKYQKLLGITSKSSQYYIRACQAALDAGNMTLFDDFTIRALRIAPKNSKLLEFRAQYYLINNEITPAQKHLKLCINSASDASKCTAMLKATNNFSSNYESATKAITSKNFDQATNHINVCEQIAIKLAPEDAKLILSVKSLKVKVLLAQNKKESALKYMNDLIKASPKNDDLKIQRGELLMELGDNDGAMTDFQDVRKRQKNNKKVIGYIEKIAAIQEKEKHIDYYTLLDLKHGASIGEVKKAYKKMVVKWHPDRYKEPLKKKEAEKKMKMINKAYDVLSDPEKKKMYDLGQDPENMAPPPDNNFENSGNYGGQQNFQFGGFPGGMDFAEIIKQMMGGGHNGGGNGGNGGFGGGTAGGGGASRGFNFQFGGQGQRQGQRRNVRFG